MIFLLKTRTCFREKSYVFFKKVVRVFPESCDREQGRIKKSTISLP